MAATDPARLFRCKRTIPQIRELNFDSLHEGMRDLHEFLKRGKEHPSTAISESALRSIADKLQWRKIDPEGHSEFEQGGPLGGLVKLMKFAAEQVYCIFYPGYVSDEHFGRNRDPSKTLAQELRDCILTAGQGTLTIQKERLKTIEKHCGSDSPPAFNVMMVAREFNISEVPGDMTASQLCEILRNLAYIPHQERGAAEGTREAAEGGAGGAGAGGGAGGEHDTIVQTPFHALSRSETASAYPPAPDRFPVQRLPQERIAEMTSGPDIGPPLRVQPPRPPPVPRPISAAADVDDESVSHTAANAADALRETQEALQAVLSKLPGK